LVLPHFERLASKAKKKKQQQQKKELEPLCHPIKSKIRTNRDSLAHVSPRFPSATCILSFD